MNVSGSTILITGGATGIGLALAAAFDKRGNTVIVCGRREEKLKQAAERLPRIRTIRCDVAEEAERRRLFEQVTTDHPELNILVNNAGIQRMIDFRKGPEDLASGENEIRINLEAPVFLSALFAAKLMKMRQSAIVNVSSGLAFAPLSIMPVYCATKAAIHSFSMSLRRQLAPAGVKVFEIIPPTVDTELDRGARGRRGQTDRGIRPEEVAEAAVAGISADTFEIAVGQAQGLIAGSRADPNALFDRMNQSF
jgi:uncharacterized oxidoreductase